MMVRAVTKGRRVEAFRDNAAAQKAIDAGDDADQLASLLGLAQRLKYAVLVELSR